MLSCHLHSVRAEMGHYQRDNRDWEAPNIYELILDRKRLQRSALCYQNYQNKLLPYYPRSEEQSSELLLRASSQRSIELH